MKRRPFIFGLAIAIVGTPFLPDTRAGASIERSPVESTSLASVGYDGAGKILEIEFRSGAVYQYVGVPEKVYRELLAADSKGRYFLKNIRGSYEFVKAPVKTQ